MNKAKWQFFKESTNDTAQQIAQAIHRYREQKKVNKLKKQKKEKEEKENEQ